MIKFCFVEPDKLKTFTVMLGMTGEAFLSFYLRRCMITFLGSYPLPDFSVAEKAFFT
jgi:hypothetical protein